MGRFINADAFTATGQGLIGNNMFAYCNNNPVCCSDPSGFWGSSSGISNPNAMLRDGCTPAFPMPNDKYSKTSGLINGQGVFPHANESMMFGNYANNGCGIIAIYNALQLLGYNTALGTIEDQIFLRGGMWAGGLLGVKPWTIESYLKSTGMACSTYFSYDVLSSNVYDGAVIIFMVQNNASSIFDGCHYMAAQYSGGIYTVYNASNYSTQAKSVSTLNPVYGNSAWLCGFIVGG